MQIPHCIADSTGAFMDNATTSTTTANATAADAVSSNIQ